MYRRQRWSLADPESISDWHYQEEHVPFGALQVHKLSQEMGIRDRTVANLFWQARRGMDARVTSSELKTVQWCTCRGNY